MDDPQVPAALVSVAIAAAYLAWHQANAFGLLADRSAPESPAPSGCAGCAFAKGCAKGPR